MNMYVKINIMGSCELNLSGSEYRPVMESCEHGNEFGVCLKCRVFLDKLNTC